MTTTRPWRLGLLTLAAALIITGCHGSGPQASTAPETAATAPGVLQSLPSFEETRQQLEVAIGEIKGTANRLIPSITWESLDGNSGGRCLHPYDGGIDQFLPNEVAEDVPVSEQQWAQIQEAARRAAAKLGADEIQVMRDGPGSHDVGFYGPAELSIKLAYRGNLVVSGYTGCRLPQNDPRL